SYPRERLAAMLEDAGAPVVLTQRRLAAALPAHGGRTVCLDEPGPPTPVPGLAARVEPDTLAYVIFTSGSTGRPKGVMNSHRGIVNRLLWMQETYRLTPADRVLQKTPVSFDVSVWELFWPLLTGACLVVARPGEHQEPARLARTIAREAVTTLHFVPAMLQAFLEEPAVRRCQSVRQVMASGEALPATLAERFFERLPGAVLHNLYGPTEAAVDVTFWACQPGSARPAVPIGRPVANTAIHLFDAGLRPVPVGVPGELFIGGVQVARGYFGRPELTAERFLPDPQGVPGARLYRTGDLVRRLPAGEIEFLGRIDHQVKIRGLRIELGEIEAALARHPGVQEAVVLAEPGPAGDPADRRLVAYLVPGARRAAPLKARLRLEREGRLAASDLHELPDGTVVAHRNRGETEFLYREIFAGEGYLRHGLALADGDTVFDVGANIGLFALFAGRRARGVRIYAFEPIPEVFAALARNAALHGLDARLFDCGLADAPGVAEFTYYPHATLISGRFADAGEERAVVLSFVAAQAGEGEALDAARLEELLTERLEARQVTCRLRTLSEVIAEEGVGRIDLLKIDVEKSELAVLAGLAEEDWSKVRQVVLEVHDVEGRLAQVLALLSRHGFEVAAEQDTELAGTALYNLYARRPLPPLTELAGGEPRTATPAEPAWGSAGRLTADVAAALRAELPEFMVPAVFVVLEALPLSPSGKVDRRALACHAPGAAAPTAPASPRPAQTAPGTPVERRLAELWAELLHREPGEIGP
ncbi:MAG TPA: amino acid adenylation domain-containing protein, partial [Thermoanaerobaculia bacterium]|nr:amino acid adenylation domain-containing protein [Thermoanaerobaculia bacterium]